MKPVPCCEDVHLQRDADFVVKLIDVYPDIASAPAGKDVKVPMGGYQMLVQVQNTGFPLVDRNPQKFVDIYTCDASDFQKANIKIYHDKKNSSALKVNVLKN